MVAARHGGGLPRMPTYTARGMEYLSARHGTNNTRQRPTARHRYALRLPFDVLHTVERQTCNTCLHL